MRELQAVQYSNQQFSDENLLLNFKLLDPVTLSKNLTWLWGKASDEFSLTYMTEGNGAVMSVKSVGLNDTQFKWKIMGRPKTTFRVIGCPNSLTTTLGINRTTFELDFDEDFGKYQQTLISPDGLSQCRVQSVPRQIGVNRFRYTLQLLNGTLASYVAASNYVEGMFWAVGAAAVAASKSDGTSSTHMAPGEMTNQFGFYRHSYELAGNVTNKVTNIEFDLPDGAGKTNKWIPFDYKMFELTRKRELEEELWYSEYNRDANGVILDKDPETGEPIPRGAGIKQILTSTGQYDTYSTLTLGKLKAILNGSISNRIDSTPTEIVLYTGLGGMNQFHEALVSDASANSYFQSMDKTVTQGNGGLSYGAYFNTYKTIDGYTITVKRARMFDHGMRAEQQRKNGDMINGNPRESYNMVILDHSMTNDGGRNIMKVYEDGREYISGVYKGLSPVPEMWGSINNLQLGTRRDISAYEVMTSQGIHMYNYTTSFWLERV